MGELAGMDACKGIDVGAGYMVPVGQHNRQGREVEEQADHGSASGPRDERMHGH
jgi:hypothetical protein